MNRLCHAAKQFNVKKDEYEEFVFVLRSIRESYHIPQREMATLMNVTQGTISKFESFDLTARLDFFITYADALGYQLILTDESKDANEPSRFRKRQSRISTELSDPSQFEELSASPTQKMGIMPKSIVYDHKKRIIKRLLEARRNVEKAAYRRVIAEAGNIPDIGLSNLLPDDFRDRYAADMMAKTFRMSERMIRRFEKDDAYMPTASLAFKYAAYMRAEFRLSEKLQTPEESMGSFYMRNCLALHNTFEKPTNVLKKIQKSSDKYDEFIFVLRSIRESYQIHQGEMATLMGVSQSTISKFEAGSLDVRWDFLLLYARFLGYRVENSSAGRETELSRFNELQRQISEDLLNVQIEGKYFSRVHCETKWPAEIVELTKRSVILELVIAKHTHNHANYEISRINKLEEIRYNGHINSGFLDGDFNFSEKPEMSERTAQRAEVDDRSEPTTPVYIDKVEELTTDILAKKLGISERTLRRFDNEEDYMPSAALVFKYASLVNCELRLVETRDPNESPGDFYIGYYLVIAFILHESGGNPLALNTMYSDPKQQASGLMQIIPQWHSAYQQGGQYYNRHLNVIEYAEENGADIDNLFDPLGNITIGMMMLSEQRKLCKNPADMRELVGRQGEGYDSASTLEILYYRDLLAKQNGLEPWYSDEYYLSLMKR